MPRYRTSRNRASVLWPCTCSRVLVRSTGKVPAGRESGRQRPPGLPRPGPPRPGPAAPRRLLTELGHDGGEPAVHEGFPVERGHGMAGRGRTAAAPGAPAAPPPGTGNPPAPPCGPAAIPPPPPPAGPRRGRRRSAPQPRGPLPAAGSWAATQGRNGAPPGSCGSSQQPEPARTTATHPPVRPSSTRVPAGRRDRQAALGAAPGYRASLLTNRLAPNRPAAAVQLQSSNGDARDTGPTGTPWPLPAAFRPGQAPPGPRPPGDLGKEERPPAASAHPQHLGPAPMSQLARDSSCPRGAGRLRAGVVGAQQRLEPLAGGLEPLTEPRSRCRCSRALSPSGRCSRRLPCPSPLLPPSLSSRGSWLLRSPPLFSRDLWCLRSSSRWVLLGGRPSEPPQSWWLPPAQRS